MVVVLLVAARRAWVRALNLSRQTTKEGKLKSGPANVACLLLRATMLQGVFLRHQLREVLRFATPNTRGHKKGKTTDPNADKRADAGRCQRARAFEFSVWRANFPGRTSAKSAEGCKGCTTEKSTAKGEFSISSTNTSAGCRGLFPAPPYKKIQQKDDKINFFLQQFLLSFLTRYPFFAGRFYIFLFLFLLSRILCFACHGSPFVHEYQLTTQPVHPTTPSRRRVGSGLPHRSHGKKLENQPPKKKSQQKDTGQG